MAELLRMPEVAAGMESAVLSTWVVAEHTAFAAGDIIAIIETDKAVVDVEAEQDGIILRALANDGAEVAVGAPIALIAATGESVEDVDAALKALGVGESEGRAPSASTGIGDAPTAASSVSVSESPVPSGRRFASPLARRLAKDVGLDISQITGTGPSGRIVRRDVEAAAGSHRPDEAPSPTPAGSVGAATPAGVPTQSFTDIPHSRLRRAIASRLTESKQAAPHFYLRGSANVDRLLAMRAELNSGDGPRVSVNDLIIKAVAGAHVLVPAMNVTWGPDAVRNYSSVDVAVAIATDNGLVTPVLRGVEAMSVTSVARSVKDFAERARSGRLQQQELEGGSISVTNLGMYGTEEFAAIINPPQAAILAVGAARQEPRIVDGGLTGASVIRVTLSIDHRPVDGVVGAKWMGAFLELLEHPARILG